MGVPLDRQSSTIYSKWRFYRAGVFAKDVGTNTLDDLTNLWPAPAQMAASSECIGASISAVANIMARPPGTPCKAPNMPPAMS
jgi:hypothetical protein